MVNYNCMFITVGSSFLTQSAAAFKFMDSWIFPMPVALVAFRQVQSPSKKPQSCNKKAVYYGISGYKIING